MVKRKLDGGSISLDFRCVHLGDPAGDLPSKAGDRAARERELTRKANTAGTRTRGFWDRWLSGPSLRQTLADLRGGGELPWIGYRIFKWLLLLIFIILILLVAFAYLTYPRIGDIQKLAGSRTNIDIIKEWSDARSAWVTQMKDLGQIFLFTPVFPLLAAVVGYIFGRQQQLQSTDGTREQAPEAPEEPGASTR